MNLDYCCGSPSVFYYIKLKNHKLRIMLSHGLRKTFMSPIETFLMTCDRGREEMAFTTQVFVNAICLRISRDIDKRKRKHDEKVEHQKHSKVKSKKKPTEEKTRASLLLASTYKPNYLLLSEQKKQYKK